MQESDGMKRAMPGFADHNELSGSLRPMTLKILIAHHDTVGLGHDAAVLSAAIQAARPQARIIEWVLPDWCLGDTTSALSLPQALQEEGLPCDYLFLLEHAFANPPLLTRALARHVVYVPNIEWIFPTDEAVMRSGALDAVLIKTRHALSIFRGLPSARNLEGATHFVGWTSRDPGFNSAERKDLEFLHAAGSSVQKGTDALVEAWLQRPDLPSLTVTAFAQAPIRLPSTLFAAHNLRLHLAPLAPERFRDLQQSAAVHICPSVAEGFGHSINEARATGAVVVTTSAPPMNELVEDGWNGFLVPVRLENARPYRLSTAYVATGPDILEAVARCLALSAPERLAMGGRARAAFEAGQRHFNTSIANFLDRVGA